MAVDGKPVGRITSSRYSPIRNKTVGLAWVPVAAATEGTEIQIQAEASPCAARVTLEPFYDPEGLRLRQ
ncbi:MAG: glycine cleavage T C-terminal barrel domain-containing protein [Burkholderiales bacterium]